MHVGIALLGAWVPQLGAVATATYTNVHIFLFFLNNNANLCFLRTVVFNICIYIVVTVGLLGFIFRRAIFRPHLGLFGTVFIPGLLPGPRLGHFKGLAKYISLLRCK